jgi:hypothetical protein
MEITMRSATATAILAVLFCTPALAQMSGDGSPPPAIGATSTLGITPGSPVAPTGIPMGAMELSSPGISPLPTGALGAPGYGTISGYGTGCSTSAQPSSSSSTVYDGGGMQVGASLPASAATMESCGASSSSTAATSPTAPGGPSRTGIPLGSVQIGNAGVSPQAFVPTPSQTPLMASPPPSMTASPLPPTTMSPSPSTMASPSSFTPARPFSRVPAR